MTPWLLENLPRILGGLLLGTGVFGAVGVLLRKSWNQSVRLYKDELVSCQELRKGDAAQITQLQATIAFQDDRTKIREEHMADLLAWIKLLEERTTPHETK